METPAGLEKNEQFSLLLQLNAPIFKYVIVIVNHYLQLNKNDSKLLKNPDLTFSKNTVKIPRIFQSERSLRMKHSHILGNRAMFTPSSVFTLFENWLR